MKNKRLIKKTLNQPGPTKNKYNIKLKKSIDWKKNNNIINSVLQGCGEDTIGRVLRKNSSTRGW
jgi:hypothetical protein